MNFLKLSRNNVPVLVDVHHLVVVEAGDSGRGSNLTVETHDETLIVQVDESPTEIYHMLLIRVGKDPIYESLQS